MNKIYKVVFDKRTESFVVVSELAATHGKASSSTDERKTPTKHSLSKLAASLVLGSSLLATQSALADYTADGGTANDTKYRKAIAIGQGAKADGVEGPIAIGGEIVGSGATEALGQGAVAIGSSAKAKEKQTVAVGQKVVAEGNQSIALGADVLAKGIAAIVIGGDDADDTSYQSWAWSEKDGKVKEKAGRYQTATAEGNLSIALGSKVQAKGDGSIAMGVVATSIGLESISVGAKSSTKGTNSIAIGTESASVGDNSVAMGAQSLAQEASTVAIGDAAQSQSANSTVIGKDAHIGKDKDGGVVLGYGSQDTGSAGPTLSTKNTVDVGRYTYKGFAGTINDQGDFVSIGRKGDERKIINLAPADITSDSTEAVNGSQLYVVLDDVGKLKEALGVDPASGTIPTKTYTFDIANNESTTKTFSGAADTWTLQADDTLTFGATEDLTVSTDGAGKVIYSISDSYKKDVGSKIKVADDAAKAADAKAVAAQNDATKALGDAADAKKAADAADKKAQDAQDGVDAINQKLLNSADNAVVGNGKDGKDGAAGKAGATGLTGADGLNGKDLTTKVNALRNGEAGPVVYTDENGNRLAKGNDGKYYPADQVQENGEPKPDATPVDNPIASVVNPDGTAATPTTMGNIKSTVGLDSPANAAITADKAKEGVDNLLKKTTGLNNAATVGDLQALAQAGIDFTGDNSAVTVHRPLGSKLTVEGEGNWDGANSATNNLYVEANGADNKLVVKLNKELTGLSKVETTDEKGNTATLTPTGTEVKDANGNEATYGADGASIKAKDGKTTTIEPGKVEVSNGADTTTIEPGVITGLKDLDESSDPTSAVNKKYVDEKLGASDAVVGTASDGKDGAAGKAGATGLTGADGLNGKDLTTKVNALRNGEAGPLVYTDEAGNRLAKGNDGKYYPAAQVQENGEPKADATPVDNPIASVVNPDGTAATPTTMGNIKSTVGLDSPANAAITADKAKEGVDNLLEKTTGLNNAATVGDLQALAQAGIDFTGDNSAVTVHRPLGSKLTVEGEGDWDGANSAANNLYVEANETDNKLVVKLNKELTGLSKVETTDGKGNTATLTPTGTEVKDKGGNKATYGADGASITNGTDTTTIKPGVITGLKDLDESSDPTSAVNKKYVDEKLGASDSVLGTGSDGKDGAAGKAGATGLTGQDGLNGKDLTTKVNALRNGEAGPLVYTDEAGNRLAKGNDGKYYPADQVQENGEPNPDATPVDNPIASVVNPDGTVAKPTALGNIKSTVGLDSPANAAITADKAKEGVEGLLSKTTGLNNAATVGDLQALAQAGIDFTGDNSAVTVHRPLGSKLTVEGEGNWDGANSAANNLYVEANETDNKLVVKLNKELTGLSKVETTDGNGNTATLTPTGTEVKDAAGNTASYGAQGATVTDGATGSTASYDANGVTVKDKNGNPTITVANVDGTPTLSFGTDENGNGTGKITGVASGEVGEGSSDVVTGGQLHTLREEILTNVKGELDGKMANLANEVDRNNRELRGGIATVTAMSSIPQVTLPGKSAVGVGAGTFEGESAISVGYSRMSDNGRVIVKVSAGASTQNTFNLGAGLAYQW